MIGSKRAVGGAGAALLAGALAVIVLNGGDDKPKTAAKTTPTTARPAQEPPATPDEPVAAGQRPNSLTIGGGRVWAIAGSTVFIYDPATRDRDLVGIGEQGKSIAAGLRSIWAVKGEKTRSLLQISRKRPRVLARTTIASSGEPIIVTTGAGAVWVGVRGLGNDAGPESVVKVSPGDLGQQSIDVPDGVQHIAVGEGALWVSHRSKKSVLRMRIDSGERKLIPVDGLPKGITVGEGAVWVATRGSDTITRINPRSGQTRPIDLDYAPTQVAVGGGSVWATAEEANRLIRINPKRGKVIDNIETGKRPFALDVTKGNSVWLTLLGDDSIQRVRFTR